MPTICIFNGAYVGTEERGLSFKTKGDLLFAKGTYFWKRAKDTDLLFAKIQCLEKFLFSKKAYICRKEAYSVTFWPKIIFVSKSKGYYLSIGNKTGIFKTGKFWKNAKGIVLLFAEILVFSIAHLSMKSEGYNLPF